MGTTLPSGMVTVVGAAVRLIVCWPKPMTVAKRKNPLARSTALSLALKLKSFIRIIVIASRCGSVVDMQPEFFLCRLLRPVYGAAGVGAGRAHRLPQITGFRQSQIRVNPPASS